VTPFALLPRTEGHRKRMAMTFDKLIAEGCQVDILFISREYDWSALFNPDLFKQFQALGHTAHFVHAPTPTAPRNAFFEIDEWWPAQADDYCRWLFDNNGYEIIFCNYVFMSRVFDLCGRAAIRIIDTHDLFADRDRVLIENGLKPEFYYTDGENEAKGLNRADLVIAIKDEEAEYFRKVSDSRVVTLPYVEAMPAHDPDALSPPVGRPIRFGFFGSQNSINVRNIEAFVRFLESRRPAEGYPFEFWLYGSLCKRLKGPMPDYVRLGGMVETTAEFYSSIDCIVNPQYFSTGLKIKLAEGLAFGVPLICHRHSFEGFGAPLNAAQDCADFDQVLAAMMGVVADPARLKDLGLAVRAVQKRQMGESDRQWRRILSGDMMRSRWLYFLVSVDCFNRVRLYRHLVEMTFATFARSYMICVVADREDDGDSLWRLFKRKANRFAHGVEPAEVAAGAVLFLFDDPAEWQTLVGGRAEVVVFDDAVAMARRSHDKTLEAPAAGAHPNWVVVRGDTGTAAPDHGSFDLPINYFRWLPWDMSVPATGDQYDRLEEIWVLIDETTSAGWRAVADRVFAGRRVRFFGGGEAATAAHLMDCVFTGKQTPELVISMTLNDSFGPMKAWFTANGIAVRELAGYVGAGAGERVQVLGLPRISEIAKWPDSAALEENVRAVWRGSGWDELARITGAWTKGRTVSGATL